MVNTPFVYVDPPVIEPYRHGLFSVVPPTTKIDDMHWAYGGIEFESLACYASQTYPGGLTDINGSGGAKVLPACLGRTYAAGFAIFGGVATGSLGHNENDNRYWTDRAVSIVEKAGQHAVETALWTGTAGASPALNAASTPLVAAGQANTTAAAFDIVTGLALCEKYATDHYAGRAVIHAPRVAAPYMAQAQLLRQEPDAPQQWTTPLGTRLAFGGGYDGTGPGALAPPTSTTANQYFYMYVTGELLALRGDIETPGTFGEALDRTGNQVRLYAEQSWVVAVDCMQAGILVRSQTIS